MADYRLFYLGLDGRISHAAPMVCETDEEAIEAVASQPNQNGMELWQLSRLVRRFDPPQEAAD